MAVGVTSDAGGVYRGWADQQQTDPTPDGLASAPIAAVPDCLVAPAGRWAVFHRLCVRAGAEPATVTVERCLAEVCGLSAALGLQPALAAVPLTALQQVRDVDDLSTLVNGDCPGFG